MTVLFDYDSLIYGAVYKIASFGEIKQWFKDQRSREWMEKEIVHLSINRLMQMNHRIFMEIEDTGIEIDLVEYYITTAKKPQRNEIYPQYKSHRKGNKWVRKVRAKLIEMEFAKTSDVWEADDLIGDDARGIPEHKRMILSMDKDLKTIPGIHFDYYRPRLKDENGDPLLDEWGNRVQSDCRGLDVVTHAEAVTFFWKQMIMGDPGDGIKGIPRKGPKAAEKALYNQLIDYYPDIVKGMYVDHYGAEGLKQFWINYSLLYIGTDREDLEKSLKEDILEATE